MRKIIVSDKNIQDFKNKSGIYCYQNDLNGKKYIGQAQDLLKRMRNHESNFIYEKYKKIENIYLWNSVNSNGRENFSLYILEFCPIENLNEKEIYYIKKFKTKYDENGYNIIDGGKVGARGYKHSEETKEKIGDASRGENSYWYGKRGEGTPMWGKKQTEYQKKTLSEKMMGNRNFKVVFGEEHWSFGKTGIENKKYGTKHEKRKSKYYGVYDTLRKKNKWIVKIFENGKSIVVGRFENEEDAGRAYDKYIKRNKLNRPLNF